MASAEVAIGETTVTKTLRQAKFVLPETQRYRRLRALVNSAAIGDGWRVDVPEILEIDVGSNAIVMMRAAGMTIGLLVESKKPVPWRRVGEAFGALHGTASEHSAPTLHGDPHFYNVIVSEADKIVWLIDPKSPTKPVVGALDDVLVVLWAMFRWRLQGFRISLRAESEFLRGWEQASGFRCSFRAVIASLGGVAARLKRGHLRRGRRGTWLARAVWSRIWLPASLLLRSSPSAPARRTTATP